MKNIAFVPLILLILIGCASTPYKQARKIGTIEAYESFLKEYPDSPDTLKARKRIERMYLDRAIRETSPEAYSGYLKQFPGSTYLNEACKSLEQAFERKIVMYNDAPLPANKILALSQILVDTAPIVQTCKSGHATLLSLYERLSLEYVKARMFPEARLALALAIEHYHQLGSRVIQTEEGLMLVNERSSRFTSDKAVRLYAMTNQSFYEDLKFLTRAESETFLARLCHLAKFNAAETEMAEDEITFSVGDTVAEAWRDTTFLRFTLGHFASGKGERTVCDYLLRFDADSSCYPQVKRMMYGMMYVDPINYAVVDALQNIGKCIRDSLLNVAEASLSSAARIHAILGLAWLDQDSATPNHLREMLSREQEAKVKVALNFAIEKLGGSDSLGAMIETFSSAQTDLREMGLSLSRYTRRPVPAGRVILILQFGSKREQCYACQIVKRRPYSERVARTVIPLLGSEDEDVRSEAKDVLEKYYPECIGLLVEGLRNKNPYVRENCISLLAAGSDTTGHQAVIAYIRDSHWRFAETDFIAYTQMVEAEYEDYFREAERRAMLSGGYISLARKQQFIEDVARDKANQFMGNLYIAYAHMKYQPAVEEILNHLEYKWIGRHCALALVLYGDNRLIPALRQRFTNPTYPFEKNTAGFALAGYEDSLGVAFLASQLEGRNSEMAMNFVNILKPVKAIPALAKRRAHLISKLGKGRDVDETKQHVREATSLLTRLYVKKYAL